MIILGYILTVINYLSYCASRFCKEKKNILLLDIFAKVITVLSFICLKSMTGAVVMFISILLLIVAYFKENHKLIKVISISGFLFFNILYIINICLTYNGLSSILVTVTAFLTLISIWWFKPQNMRLMGIFVSIIYLFYQISIKNWAGLLEILVILANIISFMKYKNKDTAV